MFYIQILLVLYLKINVINYFSYLIFFYINDILLKGKFKCLKYNFVLDKIFQLSKNFNYIIFKLNN